MTDRDEWISFDEYQKETRRTAGDIGGIQGLTLGAMGLAGEAGEVVDLLKKHIFHRHPLDCAKLADELGDVLWYLARLADEIGCPLSMVAKGNVAKLRKRYPDGFDPERSKSRTGEVA